MKTFAYVFAALSLLANGCSRPPPRPQEPAQPRKAGGETRMLFPRIMHEMPESGVVDLGPVIVLRDISGLETLSVLQEAAERLGADAFVLERRELSEAYPVQTQRVGSYLETFDGTTYQVTAHLYRGTAGQHGGTKTSEKGFYRAIRFVDEAQPPCRLDSAKLGPDLVALFEGATTLKEQLRILSVLVARGLVSAPILREVRKHCLDQVPRK
jgi:hypothetical protein